MYNISSSCTKSSLTGLFSRVHNSDETQLTHLKCCTHVNKHLVNMCVKKIILLRHTVFECYPICLSTPFFWDTQYISHMRRISISSSVNFWTSINQLTCYSKLDLDTRQGFASKLCCTALIEYSLQLQGMVAKILHIFCWFSLEMQKWTFTSICNNYYTDPAIIPKIHEKHFRDSGIHSTCIHISKIKLRHFLHKVQI